MKRIEICWNIPVPIMALARANTYFSPNEEGFSEKIKKNENKKERYLRLARSDGFRFKALKEEKEGSRLEGVCLFIISS